MYSYDTVTEAISELKKRGFVIDFNMTFNDIQNSENELHLNPSEFSIVEVYRFEGNSDPADEDVVYAIQSNDEKIKGIITGAFGTYADGISDELMKKLTMHTH